MKKLLFICLFPTISFAQSQIGDALTGEASFDQSGKGVSLSADGSIVAIGAHKNGGNGNNSGHVRVFQNEGGVWSQIGADIDGEAAFDESGWSVSLSDDGNVVAIGAIYNGDNGYNSGHVRIYENEGGTWTQVGEDLDGAAPYDESGYSLSLSADGSVVAIGAPLYDESVEAYNVGMVRVYENVGGSWTQAGADILGLVDGDRCGWSVSLSADGSVVAVGAPNSDENGTNAGSVRVFENNAGTWTQVGATLVGEAAEDQSGNSVSLSADGSVVAIGAFRNGGNGDRAGHVRVYENNAGTWTQVGSDIDGEAAEDRSGWSVALSDDGTVVAIGAYQNNNNGNNAGQVRVFKNTGGSWFQAGSALEGEAADDLFGSSVALSADGTVVACGAPQNSSSGFYSGQVRVYDVSGVLASDAHVKAGFTVYPNPSTDFVTVQLDEGLLLQRVHVYTTTGQRVKTAHQAVVSLSGLARGPYLLQVVTNQGQATRTVIVE